MHFVREIWLRHVKCAAAREGIYFISHCDEGAIFHNLRSKLFHIHVGEYFTKYTSFFIYTDTNERCCACGANDVLYNDVTACAVNDVMLRINDVDLRPMVLCFASTARGLKCCV